MPATPTRAEDKPTGTYASSGATLTGIHANDDVPGVLVRAGWKDIETSPGVFELAAIDLDAEGGGRPARAQWLGPFDLVTFRTIRAFLTSLPRSCATDVGGE